ncbi:MAG: hypothetical protein GC158_11230 [Cyanobacteria bacterium RI_101]|nr:hypothetical protein [Cyanobacteria bacterium RI_101]
MKNADSLESILADMRQKYLEVSEATPEPGARPPLEDGSNNPRPSPSQHPSLDRLLKELERERPKNPPPDASVTPAKKQSLEPELDCLAPRKKADNSAKIAQKAQQWLNELDPLSGEGIWFAELAKHYPSALDAAIDLFAR